MDGGGVRGEKGRKRMEGGGGIPYYFLSYFWGPFPFSFFLFPFLIFFFFFLTI